MLSLGQQVSDKDIWNFLEQKLSNVEKRIEEITKGEPDHFTSSFITGYTDVLSLFFYLDKNEKDSIFRFLYALYNFHDNTNLKTKSLPYKMGMESAWSDYQVFIIFGLKKLRDLEEKNSEKQII